MNILKSNLDVKPYLPKNRSSRSQIFFKTGIAKNFVILTGKLFYSGKLDSIFHKIKKFSHKYKKRLQHRCFPVNIAKFLKTAFL